MKGNRFTDPDYMAERPVEQATASPGELRDLGIPVWPSNPNRIIPDRTDEEIIQTALLRFSNDCGTAEIGLHPDDIKEWRRQRERAKELAE